MPFDHSRSFGLSSRPGRFGRFGGRYVPETLMQPLMELEEKYFGLKDDREFQSELANLQRDFIGRETPLFLAEGLAKELKTKCRIYLKREDLAHTGAHKINNAVGQVLLAKKMHKTRLIAETGAGQHGVATAAVAAKFGMKCVVYMGAKDMERQLLNVQRMRLMGATVVPVTAGAATLKEAVAEAMRDWVGSYVDTHYVLGSALGPHPYPEMVRDFQCCIGQEARAQILSREGRLPDELIACVGGGSNSIGLFYPFLGDSQVSMHGVEAGGEGPALGEHAARFLSGSPGVFQGTETMVLQTEDGQIAETKSVSAGLDYAAVGPEHAFLHATQRVQYHAVSDTEALQALALLCRVEGILPALESAHALAFAIKQTQSVDQTKVMIVGLSGRGDKDLGILQGLGEI